MLGRLRDLASAIDLTMLKINGRPLKACNFLGPQAGEGTDCQGGADVRLGDGRGQERPHLHDIGGDGRILPDPRRPERALIEYRAGQMEERQRFTMFHEFAHTLFPDYCELKTYHQDAETKDPSKEFENLCDTAAAEFMMPVDEFAADLRGKKIDGALVEVLKTRYHASIDATVRRVIDLTASVAVGAVFLLAANGSKREVLYSLKSTLFTSYYPGGTKVGWDGADNAPQVITLYFNNLPRTYLVEALPLPIIPENSNYPTTVLLLQPTGPRSRTRIV
jgi:hypothetical protein